MGLKSPHLETVNRSSGESIDDALVDYFTRIDRGEPIDFDSILATHPVAAIGLRHFFALECGVCDQLAVDFSARSELPSLLTGCELGDFRLGRVLGRGGMGTVFEAEQLALKRRVAVKVFSSVLGVDPRHRARFKNESEILAQLKHSHIVDVILVGEAGDHYFYAMRLIDGGTAETLIELWSDRGTQPTASIEREGADRKNNSASASIPPSIARLAQLQGPARYLAIARIGSQVASALVHAHECGVLHRDIKPSNILIDVAGDAYLSDFGLARIRGQGTLTALGDVVGTLRYASPEQICGRPGSIDERSDVYSLGATLWEMLTGRRLFDSDDNRQIVQRVLEEEPTRPAQYWSDVPVDLETIALTALAKEPARRYQSAQFLVDDLRRYLAGQPIQARRTPISERAFLWINRNRKLATVAAGLLLLITIGAVAATALVLQANSRTADALTESQANEQSARQHAAAAEASSRRLQSLLYAADMALAGAAWEKGEAGQARMFLDRYAGTATSDTSGDGFDPRGFEWHFLDRQTRPRSQLLYQHDDALYAIESSPDGKSFLTAGKDSVLRRHDARSGRMLQSRNTDQIEVNCITLSPSGKLLVTCGDDGSVKLWDAATLELQRSLPACERGCFVARFIGDDTRLITGGRSDVLRLWDTANGKLRQEYSSPLLRRAGSAPGYFIDAVVSRTGEWVLTTVHRFDELKNRSWASDGVYQWDLNTGRADRICKAWQPCRVLVDRSERFVVVVDRAHVRIVDREQRTVVAAREVANRPDAVSLSPDNKTLVAGDSAGQILAWNVDLSSTHAALEFSKPTVLPLHQGLVYAATYGTANSLLTVGRDGTVRRTKLVTPTVPQRELPHLRNQAWAPIPGTDSVVMNRPLAIRERSTGTTIRNLSPGNYSCVAASADGRIVAAVSRDHVGAWQTTTGKCLFESSARRGWIRNLDLTPNGSHLLVVSKTQTGDAIEFANIASGQMDPPFLSDHFIWATFCIDDGIVARDIPELGVICWNLRDRSIRWKTPPFREYPDHASISPDRRWLITADAFRRELRLYDCRDGKVKYAVPCNHEVVALAFSNDGKSFVVGGKQGEISVWQATTGQRLFQIAKLESSVDTIHCFENQLSAAAKSTDPADGSSALVWFQF